MVCFVPTKTGFWNCVRICQETVLVPRVSSSSVLYIAEEKLKGSPGVCGQLESAHQCPQVSVFSPNLCKELWKELYETSNCQGKAIILFVLMTHWSTVRAPKIKFSGLTVVFQTQSVCSVTTCKIMVTSVVGHMSVATEYFRMILEYPRWVTT